MINEKFFDIDEITTQSSSFLSSMDGVFIIAPHPDDESLGCGGTIALLRQYNVPVHIILLSDGTRSHPNSIKFPAQKLKKLRENELIAAAAVLGVGREHITFCGYEDRCVPNTETSGFEAAVENLHNKIKEINPSTIFVPWRRDPHPDHIAANQLINAGINNGMTIIEYPIWMYDEMDEAAIPSDEEVRYLKIDISSVLKQKQLAIQSHLSQISDMIDDDPTGFKLSEEMLENFNKPFEIFFINRNTMPQPAKTLDSKYFKDVYDANDDPWDFENSPYEAAKYLATINALPKSKYQKVLELGCSIGILTRMLAQKCDYLLATDISEKALSIAEKNCENIENIVFRKMDFSQDLPEDTFDLIVISEIAYYLSPLDWKKVIDNLFSIMKPQAQVLLVHWLPEVHDYPQSGDEVHEAFKQAQDGRMKNIKSDRAEKYRLDLWEKC